MLKLFVVRHIDDKQAVGFFWVHDLQDLIIEVDASVTEPEMCEYIEIEEPGGFVWTGFAPTLGTELSDLESEHDDRVARLLRTIEPIGSVDEFFYEPTLEEDWRPLITGPRRRAPRPDPVAAESPPPVPPPARRQLPAQEFPLSTIYFIGCDDHVKIGITGGAVERRMKALATGHHRELVLLAKIENAKGELEIELHQRFAADRVRGEWFKLSPDIQAFIDEINRGAK